MGKKIFSDEQKREALAAAERTLTRTVSGTEAEARETDANLSDKSDQSDGSDGAEGEEPDEAAEELAAEDVLSDDYTDRLAMIVRLYRFRTEEDVDAVCDRLIPELTEVRQ